MSDRDLNLSLCKVLSFESLLVYFLRNFPSILSYEFFLEFREHLLLEYLSLATLYEVLKLSHT